MPCWGSLWVSLLSILLSLICASAILLVMGKNPLAAFQSFLQGASFWPKASYGGGTGMLTDLFSFLNILAPMIQASLSFIVGLKAGLFNIGISGQMLASGYLAISVVGYSQLNAVLAKPLVMLIGVAAGGLLGVFIGFLKYRFHIHEVVSTIMVNHIINYLTGFFHQHLPCGPCGRPDPDHEDLRQPRPPHLDQRAARGGEMQCPPGAGAGAAGGFRSEVHL